MTTYAELVDQIRAYTETDANVLTTTIVDVTAGVGWTIEQLYHKPTQIKI